MNLLADQDVFAVTVRYLRDHGHDVATAAELSLSRSDDEELLRTAALDRRVLLTRDRDFGGLMFVAGLDGGVIYLRILPATLNAVHNELQHVLTQYDEDVLLKSLVVVEPARHRIRRRTA
jgi:predicted nuclease of predicted toxin-antitoxin system